MADKTDLIKAYENITNTITLSKFESNISASILRNGMRTYSDKHNLEFTDEEIDATIASKGFLEKPKAAGLHMKSELEQSFDIAIQSIIAGLYDDISEKEVVNGILSYAARNNYNISREDATDFVRKKFNEFKHVSDLTPYSSL